ncbi:MAG: hypothetical protein NT027_13090 [Proteobacteria bacterium]|nr:hypothetical protein [Pseudomonadota bacterium]
MLSPCLRLSVAFLAIMSLGVMGCKARNKQSNLVEFKYSGVILRSGEITVVNEDLDANGDLLGEPNKIVDGISRVTISDNNEEVPNLDSNGNLQILTWDEVSKEFNEAGLTLEAALVQNIKSKKTIDVKSNSNSQLIIKLKVIDDAFKAKFSIQSDKQVVATGGATAASNSGNALDKNQLFIVVPARHEEMANFKVKIKSTDISRHCTINGDTYWAVCEGLDIKKFNYGKDNNRRWGWATGPFTKETLKTSEDELKKPGTCEVFCVENRYASPVFGRGGHYEKLDSCNRPYKCPASIDSYGINTSCNFNSDDRKKYTCVP